MYKEIQGLVVKSFMRKGLLIYEEIQEIQNMTLQPIPSEFPYIYEENFNLFFSVKDSLITKI